MSERPPVGNGAVMSIWRYPIKSMIGEEVAASLISEQGLLGDRTCALRDGSDGKVATAKNPRKWPTLFAFRATFDEREKTGNTSAVRIRFPDGTVVAGGQRDVNQVLSKALNRDVTLVATSVGAVSGVHGSTPPLAAKSEEYWPDMDGLDHRDTVTDFELPTGTFFDCATVHLLTTATLGRLHKLYPQGRFEIQRFRPNIVVQLGEGDLTFAENNWIGHTVAIGDEVRLKVTAPCGRCVMTTLAQGDLPADPGILRTAVQQNHANVGVYAAVVQGGTIRRGDRVTVSAD
jgi:uncharacterized protein YcbX